MPKRRGLFSFSPNTAYWGMLTVLAGCSLFFIINVELRRRSWASKTTLSLTSGQSVQVVKVIDGDEVSVHSTSGQAFVIRILGIKCFDPSVNDPALGGVGRACKAALARATEGGKLAVEFKQQKKDRRGRVLAYLARDGRDIGLALVQLGHAVVFTRYPFSRERTYLAAELEAKTRRRGLWGTERAVLRATALRATWDSQRED